MPRRPSPALLVRMLLALAVVSTGCAPDPSVPDAGVDDCEGVAPATLEPIFDAWFDVKNPTGCTASGCHGTGSGGLKFATPHQLWAATVGKDTITGEGKRVVPGDPAHSKFLEKLLPGAVGRMPSGGPYLDDAAILAVKGWICAGAPEPALDVEVPDAGTPDAGASTDAGDTDGGSPDGGEATPDAGNAPEPVIDALDPEFGEVGEPVTVLGRGFSLVKAENVVKFNGVPTTVESAIEGRLSVGVPAGASTGPVTVTVNGVTATAPVEFQVIVPNPRPVLTDLSPRTAIAGGGDVTIEATGTGFIPTSVLVLGETTLDTVESTGTRLVATVPSTALETTGGQPVVVITPGPGGGTSSPLTFTVENPVPVLSSLAPDFAARGSSATPVRLTGSGFRPDSVVSVDAVPVATTFVSATALDATIPASALQLPARRSVQVSTGTPGGGSSATLLFDVRNPAPVVSSVAPASALVGDAAFDVVLTGTGFVPDGAVTLDGERLVVSASTATSIIARIPADSTSVAAVRTLAVTNAGPGGGTSAAVSFEVRSPAPVLLSASPARLGPSSTAQEVTLSGRGFTGQTTLTVNGGPLAITSRTATRLVVSIPASLLGATGNLSLEATNPAPGGGTSAALLLPVQNPLPVLASLAPATRVAGSATADVQVDGSGFVSTSVVRVDGASAPTTYVSDTRLVVSLDAAVTSVGGTRTFIVRNPAPGGGDSASATFTVTNPAPTVTAQSPATLVAEGAPVALTLTGTGFNAQTVATIDAVPAAATASSATRLVVTVPTLTPGPHALVVTNPSPGGGSVSWNLLALASPQPQVTGFDPAEGIAGESFPLTLTGANFLCGNPATVVLYDGVQLVPTSCAATQIVVTLPARPAGTYSVQPKTGGQSGATMQYDIRAPNPVPTLSSLSPVRALVGGASFTLTVFGTNFARNAQVLWNGAVRQTVYDSPTQLTASIGASDLVNAGTAMVAVSNPEPGGGTTSSRPFTIVTPNPVPSLEEVLPASVIAGTGAVTLNLFGADFVAGAVASIDGATRVTRVVAPGSAEVDLLASDTSSARVATITITNPEPGGGESGGATFQVIAPNPLPVLDSVTPSTVLTGIPGETVTLTGSGFISASRVHVEGQSRPTTFVSATQLRTTLTAPDLAVDGTLRLTVVSPAPGGGTSAVRNVTVAATAGPPTLSSVTPTTIVAGSGAVEVTVTGTGFMPVTTAQVDGSSRTFGFVSATQGVISLLASDTSSVGTRQLQLTNTGGLVSNTIGVAITGSNPVPTLTSITPNAALAGTSGTTPLDVFGTNFVSTSVLLVDGGERIATFISATQLRVDLPFTDLANAATLQLAVRNPAPGGGTTGTLPFTVTNPVPTLSSISPPAVSVGDAPFSLGVTGSGFVTTSRVKVDGTERETTYVNATRLTAAILASDLSSAGSRVITVTSPAPGGGTSSSVVLAVDPATNPVPSIAGLSPCGVVQGAASFPLTIMGSGFAAGATVRFNGVTLTPSAIGATSITVTVPASAVATAPSTSAVDVRVSNPAPGGGDSGTITFGLASQAVTYAQVQAIFTGECIGCHDAAASGGLDLRAGSSYGNLVGVTSFACGGQRVRRCGPKRSQSVLIDKLRASGSDPACGNGAMPPGLSLPESQIKLIQDWVAQDVPGP